MLTSVLKLFNKSVLGLSLLFFTVSCGKNLPQPNAQLEDFREFTEPLMVEDFHWITGIFEEYYGMLEYKEERLGFNWEDLKAEYLNRIITEQPNHEDYAGIIQEFVARMEDAHTRTTLYRDAYVEGMKLKVSTLGFATERAFVSENDIVRVNRIFEKVVGSTKRFPIKVGDELISINDRSTEAMIKEDILRYRNLGQKESNKTMGAAYLTNRLNTMFAHLPKGKADVKVKRGDKTFTIQLEWLKVDASDLRAQSESNHQEIVSIEADGSFIIKENSTLSNDISSASYQNIPQTFRQEIFMNPDASFLKTLSTSPGKDYSSDHQDFTSGDLKFKLFETDQGLSAIYRVEDFMFSRMLCKPMFQSGGFAFSACKPLMGEDYGKAFSNLKKIGVKNLVLDLRSNGGGALSLGYELVRAFSPSGLEGNLVRVRLNEEWVGRFKSIAESPHVDVATKKAFEGYYATIQEDIKTSARMSSKVSITGRNYLYGVDKHWDGDTFILVDEMCASMCDIFSTLMQDHGLAKVIGKQSMGAGGNVIGFQESPHAKIGISQTASIMYRLDGSVIENEGVKPDLPLESTVGSTFWRSVKSFIEKGPES